MTLQEKSLHIFPHMCKRQQDDLQAMLTAVDEFGATALALSASSAQGYASFIETRDQIRELIQDIAKNYRLVEV